MFTPTCFILYKPSAVTYLLLETHMIVSNAQLKTFGVSCKVQTFPKEKRVEDDPQRGDETRQDAGNARQTIIL